VLLQLERLTKSFSERTVVDEVTLEIEAGEFVCLLGPSGCGKTTTLRMIGGFTVPDSGRVLIEGTDMARVPANLRPTSTVFQSYALFPHMSALKNVSYGLKTRRVPRKEMELRALEMLAMVGLESQAHLSVATLSGGEQQRLALARSLIINPKVLLLDEPLSNLDAQLRERMRREIRMIQSRLGITTVHVTHDQEEALGIADRVVVMNEGRIEQVGAPREVYERPASRFVAGFIGRGSFISQPNGGDELFVRPEHIELNSSGDGAPGTVTHVQFSGPVVTYFVQTERGSLQVDVPLERDQAHAVGSTVVCGIRSASHIGV